MMDRFQHAWDRVTLSPEADARIRAAIEKAQNVRESSAHSGKKAARRFARIAVIAAVIVCLLSIASLAIGTHYVALRKRPAFGKDYVEVFFEQVMGESTTLGTWEPDAVPEGFEKVKTFRSENVNLDYWQNAAGEEFIFSYELPSDSSTFLGHSMFDPSRIVEEKGVYVNGTAAWMLVYTNSLGNVHTNLYWTIPDAGVGFTLTTFDLSLAELIAIAESVTAP